MALNPQNYRDDFPVLQEKSNEQQIVYLDNAATTHTPNQVIKRIEKFYKEENSNEGRSLHELANRATVAYEGAREKVADFVGADSKEIIFTRNTTESANLVAEGLELEGKILVPKMSHHSEQLPWRRKAEEKGLEVDYLPTEKGKLDLEAAKEKIDEDTALVSVSHVSNVFGCTNPIEELAEIAHENDAYIFVDGAQSIPRIPINVKKADIDFLAFSGHKMCGPTGIGVVYGKKEILEDMEPFNVGGGMIETVEENEVKYGSVPDRFEAGTPNISGAVGLAAAIEYLEDIGLENIDEHEKKLADQMIDGLNQIEGVEIYAPEDQSPSVVSFTMNDAHPHDVAEVLNTEGVAVRAGHHCAQPQMQDLGLSGTVRASPYLYNTEEEIEKFLDAVEKVKEVF
jgi:cysteine desulfurase/selenocysteine lyase